MDVKKNLLKLTFLKYTMMNNIETGKFMLVATLKRIIIPRRKISSVG